MNCLKVKIIGTVLYIYGILYTAVIHAGRQAEKGTGRDTFRQAVSQAEIFACRSAGGVRQACRYTCNQACRQIYMQAGRDTCRQAEIRAYMSANV